MLCSINTSKLNNIHFNSFLGYKSIIQKSINSQCPFVLHNSFYLYFPLCTPLHGFALLKLSSICFSLKYQSCIAIFLQNLLHCYSYVSIHKLHQIIYSCISCSQINTSITHKQNTGFALHQSGPITCRFFCKLYQNYTADSSSSS